MIYGVPKEKEVAIMEIKTTAENRKDVVQAVREFCGEDSVYLGPPTFAYQVGNYTIGRDGTVTAEEENEELREFLVGKGLVAPEVTMMNVAVPTGDITPAGMKNLIFLLHSKQYLMNRMVGYNAFSISEKLIEELEQKQPEDMDAFYSLLAGYADKNLGFAADAEQITFIFPAQEDAGKNAALTELMANMVQYVRSAKRVNPKLVMEENEKYYLRSWLLRIGFSGKEAKEKRSVLLQGLKGHTAFRTPQDEEKWKAARAAAKAEKEDDPLEIPALTPEQEMAEAMADAALIHEVNSSFED